MADMTIGVIAAIAAEGIPVHGTVILDLEGRIAVGVEPLSVFLRHRRRLFLVVLCKRNCGTDQEDKKQRKRRHSIANIHSNLFRHFATDTDCAVAMRR